MKSKKIVSLFILFLAIGYSNSVSSQNQLDYKVMMGYQGWFLAPGDGSTTNNPWSHWFRGGTAATPDAANLTVDMWPDMSEYTDKFNTNMTYANGSNAQLFSSYSLSTTRKHFEWMSNYNVHGIYLQRFLSAVELQTSGMFRAKNKVLNNVMTSAAEYNRKYAVMYDVSGVTDATMYAKIVADWEYLVNTYDILNKPEYVKQNGKPVVAIWGIGFKNRGLTTATSQAIIDYFKTNAAPQYRAYVMGGVPEHWRTLSGSSETGAGWTAVYNSLDMISPWSVGRYSNNSGADSFKTNNIVPDLAACNNNNKDYMPVIWPGFSWKNLKSNSTPPSIETLNTTPRNGGQFYWRQAYNAVQAGVKFIYVAMFDEVDEGTAMFKITDITAKLPIQANDRLVSLDIDGVNLPSDWYLKLADQSQKMLDGTIPLTSLIPIIPPSVDLYVKADGNNNGGRTEANAFSTVDAAVAAATDGDRIYIVGAISQTSTVAITKRLTFQGMNTAVITGSTARLFNVTTASKTISFSDITFKDVNVTTATTNGAVALLSVASTLSFNNCVFLNNKTTTGSGGALAVSSGDLIITNSTFKNNISGKSGGAIYVNAASSPTVNITGCTFYDNLAQGTLGTDGGGAIFAEGTLTSGSTTTYTGQVTITNCTFFENKITKDNVDYGAIRSTNTNVSVTNSLFYNNKINGGAGASSDFGSASGGTQSFTYSIGQWISSNVDTKSNFKGAADLTSSNLRFEATLGKVIYNSVAAGIDSPIDFGSDGKDAGAWDYVVSITSLTSDGTTDITQECVSSTLVIKGMNFVGVTAVTVNGVDVASYVVNSATQITATLPAVSITAGAVVVSTPGGIATSTGNFAVNANVTPTFTQVDPICSAGILNALPTTSNNGIIGTWSPALNNTARTEYTFTPTAGQCATTATMTITINPATTDGSVTQSQTSGSYFWPYNNVTYTSSTIVAIVVGCNTATLNLTINTGQPGTGATGGNLEGSDTSYTTWNGSAWSNNAPTASVDAIINGDFSTTATGDTAGFSAKTLTVNATKTFTINTGHNITVAGAVTNNGIITIDNNANLIQTAALNTNPTPTGTAIVKRNSASIQLYDYTLWSSPVAGQNLRTFSNNTLATRFYTYNSDTNFYNVVDFTNTVNFATATGYLIRSPNNWPANTLRTFGGVFTGVLNNGKVPIALNYTDPAHSYNLVGNPYPSTINADLLINDINNTNNIESTLYFWRKTNGASGSAYATYNPAGGTLTAPSGTSVNPTSEPPNGTIQVGQGFFVKAKRASTLNFENAMRLTSISTQFFRTNTERNRIWLNLTNTSGVFSQMLVSYMTDATQGVDSLDGKYINDAPIALTSIINAEEYTIQGRALPFATTDTVPLGFKTNAAGNYTIAIDHFDGLFTGEQAIYLKDNTTGNETDLKEGSYTFTAAAGIDNARFSLKYQRTLNVDAPEFNQNNVRVYINNSTLYVNSGTSVINTIKVYDIQGRLIAQQKNVKATTAAISNLKATRQVLIVKITSEDNSMVTKKVVN
jgi:predicted outer membrane repeat protein